MARLPKVVVAGAGAFGGWIALQLLERGARVTLVDPWGPGNSRASSGGETRVMRGTYGGDQPYTALAARALTLWNKYERRWKRQFLHRTGVLWMASDRDDTFEQGSLQSLREAEIPHRLLTRAAMQRRWPQINFSGIHWGIFEPECGYLDARLSCAAVLDAFIAAGGKYIQAGVSPQGLDDSSVKSLRLSDSSRLTADVYVFACGPWLGALFPRALGDLIRPTRQDVFFFGAPAGSRFTSADLPVWADHRGDFYYGIPGNDRRGFKVADDTRGPRFDPTNGDRTPSQRNLRAVRKYVALRFPALADAPLVESRVCQYEQTPDSHFIVDRHPRAENMWIVGGGSGHGFKHGPALGELVTRLILRDEQAIPEWRLERFHTK